MVPEGVESLSRVPATQLDVFPEHRDYLERCFAGADSAALEFSNERARMIETICGSQLRTVCEDYRWLSAVVIASK